MTEASVTLCPAARNLLEGWALCQLGGRLRSAGLKARAETEDGIDDGLRQWLHVEEFWEQDRNRQFRAMALEVFGQHAPLESWVWYVPWEPRFRSCLRQGWGWVKNVNNPLPEVWDAFVVAFSKWLEENPLEAIAAVVEAPVKKRKLVRLISIRTACEMTGIALSTMQEWCRKGRFRGAIKYGDWAIPLPEVLNLEKPRRGRPRKEAA